MKNFLFCSLFTAFTAVCLLTSCSKNAQPQTLTEHRAISPFDQIRVYAPGLVEVSEGASFSLTVEGDEADLPFVETQSSNNLLNISFWKANYSTSLRIKITTPFAVKGVQNMGQATVSFLGTTKTPEMSIFSEDQGEVFFQNLETGILRANLKGTGTVKIAGKAAHETVTLSGSTNFEALDLMADEADINLMGSGSTEVSVKNMLRATIAGSGTVSYKGEPTIVEAITGSGKLVKL